MTPDRRHNLLNMKATSKAEMALAQKNHTPWMPSVVTKRVSDIGYRLKN